MSRPLDHDGKAHRQPNRGARFYVVNSITGYRLIVAPVLVILVLTGHAGLFGILLPISFFTDLIDGAIARHWKVVSVFGSKLDSIADDFTMLAGICGVFVLKPGFVKTNIWLVGIMILLLLLQNLMAFIRYGKMSSFHTYSAKIAAILQGTFLILLFLLPEPSYPLFYAASIASIVDLVEEIILVILLKTWQSDIKGLFWVLKQRALPVRKELSSDQKGL